MNRVEPEEFVKSAGYSVDSKETGSKGFLAEGRGVLTLALSDHHHARGAGPGNRALIRRSGRAVTKRDIVREIATEAGVSQSVAQAVVEALFDRLTHALFEDHRVELRTFGVFEIRARAARTARNLATGEPVPVAARNALVFRPGKRLEAGVRRVVLADKAGAANRPGRSRRSGARAAGPGRAVTRPAGQEGKATE